MPGLILKYLQHNAICTKLITQCLVAAPLVDVREWADHFCTVVCTVNTSTAFFIFWARGEIERQISSLLENSLGGI